MFNTLPLLWVILLPLLTFINPIAYAVPTSQPRLMIFISDLHLGVGRDPANPTKWHNMEDFRWHKELEDFLTRIDQNGNSKVDLILVGDTFEFWQSLNPKDCDHDDKDKNFGCTEAEALQLSSRIIEQHKKVFDDLSSFASKGENKVILIPGNHDAALMYQGVRNNIMNAFQESVRNKKVDIAVNGYWVSEDGKVYAEHGHQIGADPNKFNNWPNSPFIEQDNIKYLQQPWGEQFVQKFYNNYENEFPTIDNLSEESVGIRYAINAKGFLGTLEAVANYLRFTFTQTSLQQFGQGLGKSKKGVIKWDVTTIKTDQKTSRDRLEFLIQSMSKDEPFRKVAEENMQKQTTLPEISAFSDEEIKSICNQRWILYKTGKYIEPCKSDGELGAMLERFESANSKKERFQDHLTHVKDSLRKDLPSKGKFRIFVYAHTHKEDTSFQPFSEESWFPKVYNDGAWQRTATPQQFCLIAKEKKLDISEALARIQPEDLPPCYPYIQVGQDKYGVPEASLHYWVQEKDKTGSDEQTCPYYNNTKDESCK